MFGNEFGYRTLKGNKRCRTVTSKTLAEKLFSSWPFKLIIFAAELTKSDSLPKRTRLLTFAR